MNQHARDDETRPAGMHVRHRFGDVTPSIEADDELEWLYDRCAIAVAAPSVQGELLLERHPGSPEAVLARAEAMHAARKICERLRKIGVREQTVLEALYTERRSPRSLRVWQSHSSPPASRLLALCVRGDVASCVCGNGASRGPGADAAVDGSGARRSR
jgi:hypothetical protein